MGGLGLTSIEEVTEISYAKKGTYLYLPAETQEPRKMQGAVPSTPKSWLEKPAHRHGVGPKKVRRRHPAGR